MSPLSVRAFLGARGAEILKVELWFSVPVVLTALLWRYATGPTRQRLGTFGVFRRREP